jgi:hypothetical protein
MFPHAHAHTYTHSPSYLYVQDMLFDMSSTIKQEEAAGSSGDVSPRSSSEGEEASGGCVCEGCGVVGAVGVGGRGIRWFSKSG